MVLSAPPLCGNDSADLRIGHVSYPSTMEIVKKSHPCNAFRGSHPIGCRYLYSDKIMLKFHHGNPRFLNFVAVGVAIFLGFHFASFFPWGFGKPVGS